MTRWCKKIVQERDKDRSYLPDMWIMMIGGLFEEIEIIRTCYRDQRKNHYVYLLDQYLGFVPLIWIKRSRY
ncbi:UPF0236 family transposase-like protein [Peribacillus butanolivorans]